MRFILPDKKKPNNTKEAENSLREIKAVESKQEQVTQETLNKIFTEASEKLAEIYKGGEYAYARTHHPELYHAERDALNQVDRLWFDVLAGKVDIGAFKEVVARWQKSVIELIEKVNNEKRTS